MNALVNAIPKPVVELIDGKAMTSSQAIAKRFNKSHAHVLRDIRNIEKTCKNAEFFKSNFGLTVEINKLGNVNRKTKHYQITRDGFSLLAMGFTGEDALEWKIEYIEAFNQMADVLQFKHNDLFLQIARHEALLTDATERASNAGRELRFQGRVVKPALRSRIQELIKELQPELLGLEEVA